MVKPNTSKLAQTIDSISIKKKPRVTSVKNIGAVFSYVFQIFHQKEVKNSDSDSNKKMMK